MVGRKPVPTRLKLLKGNPGKRPLNNDEPRPEYKKPDCPDFLEGWAKEEWEYISDELFELGLLSQIDRTALAAYCKTYARWRQAEEELKTGMTATTESGWECQSVWLGIANRALELMHKFMTEFGMTPASRSRLSVVPPAQKSLLEEYLKNG
jgi:P27 family predicted phage terminase small subunit